ncbi:hypothetical protein QUC31_013905 [Theobroma cacao]
MGGPSWTVKLGKRDSTTASLSLVTSQLPHFIANLESLIDLFENKGLSPRDMVTLSGLIYNNASDIDARLASTCKHCCPAALGNGDGNFAALDLVMPNSFDNNCFKNKMQKKSILELDQVLFSGGSTDNIISEYSRTFILSSLIFQLPRSKWELSNFL